MKLRYVIPKGTKVWKIHLSIGRETWTFTPVEPEPVETVLDWHFNETARFHRTFDDEARVLILLPPLGDIHRTINAFLVALADIRPDLGI